MQVLTDPQREISFVPDVEIEEQMCLDLLQQGLVLLMGYLLNQQLHGDQHADIHMTCRKLKPNNTGTGPISRNPHDTSQPAHMQTDGSACSRLQRR